MNTSEELLEQRNSVYRDTWAITGHILGIGVIANRVHEFALSNYSKYLFNWIIILNKLLRILATPNHLDSWRDIAGYAQLVVKDLES